MKVRTKAVAALAATIAAVIAATGLVAGTGTAAQDQTAVKVAVVTDIGGLNDKGFNALAGAGLAKAKATLGSRLESRIYITNTDADRTPNLQRAAQDGYQLVTLASDSRHLAAKAAEEVGVVRKTVSGGKLPAY